jgi:hypothetical protein
VRNIAALALVAFAVFGIPAAPTVGGVSVTLQEPSQAMKAQVREVARVMSRVNAVDRFWLQYIYSNAAKVIAADAGEDPPAVVTTEGLRAVHVAILKFIWKGMAENDPGKYEGLSQSIEAVFNEVIGDKQRSLTPELRQKACEMFDAIAWAGLGKDG